MFPTQKQSVFSLSDAEGAALSSLLKEQSFNPFTSDEDFEKFASRAFLIASALPAHIIEELLRFRRNGHEDGVLIIRGFPIDDTQIGPTPSHWSLAAQTKQSFVTEMYLIGLASLLGEVFSFRSQHEGNLIQNVVPIASDAYEQVGTGSEVFLQWHSEDAFHPLRADYIGLLCLRSDPSAATTFSSLRRMNLPERYKRVLFEERFQAGIDKAHGGSGRAEDGPIIAILSGRFDDPALRVDTSCIRALPGDYEAAESLEYFIQAMTSAGRQFALAAGDIVFMDNLSLVHGRAAFQPCFDGKDRWLQRVSIAMDLRKSYPYRTHNFRIIETALAL